MDSRKSIYQDVWNIVMDDLIKKASYPEERPLLAHYTNIQTTLEILKNNEIWFSHPLNMNDLQELQFGLNESKLAVRHSGAIVQACGTAERANKFLISFDHYFESYVSNEAFDVYIWCLTEHNDTDSDGKLSMWRGYGGNGYGAAMVINTDVFVARDNSAFIIDRVHYATDAERRNYLNSIIEIAAKYISENDIQDEQLNLIAHVIFERFKLFALYSKHKGFEEEQEWRIAYMPEKDPDKLFNQYISHDVNSSGIFPKLKLRLDKSTPEFGKDFTLDTLLNKIILGPTVSGSISKRTFENALYGLGKESLKEKVFSSSIPYR